MVRAEKYIRFSQVTEEFWGHLSSLRRGLRKQWCGISFRKPTRPSLPLRKAPPLISVFFNGLYTPFGSPVSGGQKPQGRRGKPPYSVLTFLPLRLSCKESSTSNQAFLLRRKDVTALRCSEPLRSKVGGPSKVFAIFCGMGPPGCCGMGPPGKRWLKVKVWGISLGGFGAIGTDVIIGYPIFPSFLQL